MHSKETSTSCSCGYTGLPKSVSGHVGGSRSTARGPKNGRWNSSGRFITSHGYVAVRVQADHPHAWGAADQRYAYEHILVMEEHLGRPLRDDELVHHGRAGKTVNTIGNLSVLTRHTHAKEHDAERGRDDLGRFPPRDLRVRKFPEVSRG